MIFISFCIGDLNWGCSEIEPTFFFPSFSLLFAVTITTNSRRNIDHRKLQPRLLTSWKSIPIEVAPIAAYRVIQKLKELGSINPAVRPSASVKEGPLKTDQGFFIVDAPFKPMLIKADIEAGQDGNGKDGVWAVEVLARKIKEIIGVLEVGIFHGQTGPQAAAAGGLGGQRPVAAYFGMPDGTVAVRKAE
jgi:ribose 5-phosphate isomerase A